MTPAARIAAAIECLDAILAGAAPERVLTNWARASRFAGSKDRAALRDHVFAALRCRASFAHLGGGLTGRGLMIGACRAAEQDPAAFFTGEGYAPAPLTEIECHVPDGPLPEDIPDWIAALWRADLGAEEAIRIAALYRQRAPLCLRLRGDAEADLAQEGITGRRLADPPGAFIVEQGARRVQNSTAYRAGCVEIQDAGAQALCAGLPLRDGARVLDFCAGGGGKILALADHAQIAAFAHDADPGRMVDLPKRAARAGIRVTCLNAENLHAHGPYDLVLCDVPCSGSGTWRRAPQAKWDLTETALAALTATQTQILQMAAPLVAPDGALAYATCSIFSAENETPVADFLRATPGWSRAEGFRRLPDAENDGFFAVILRRS